MRERLFDLIYESLHDTCRECSAQNCTDELADHLLKNGVKAPICDVGDVVYNRKAEPYKVISIEWFSRKVTHLHCISTVTNIRHTFAVGRRSLGKTVFLTEEAALKGGAE